jgi:O-antigen ligase
MLNLLLGLVVILTASRTGVIIYVLLSISYLALSRLQRPSSFIGLTLFSALIISVLFVNFSDYFSFSYDRFFADDVGTLNSRTDIYDTYINEFIENSNFFEKLFGNGYYATLSVYLSPHNTFIAILSFFGILGLLLFTWYNLQVIFRFGRNKYKPIYLIFFVFLVSGFTLETFNFSICVFMMSLLKSTEKLNGLFSDTSVNKT